MFNPFTDKPKFDPVTGELLGPDAQTTVSDGIKSGALGMSPRFDIFTGKPLSTTPSPDTALIPTAVDQIDGNALQDAQANKTALTFQDIAEGKPLADTRAARAKERQRRVDEASANTSIVRDAASLVGSATAGVIQGAGGIVSTLQGAADLINPFDPPNNYTAAVRADGKIIRDKKKIDQLRRAAGVNPNITFGVLDGASVTTKALSNMAKDARKRKKDGVLGPDFRSGFTLFNVSDPKLGDLITRAGDALGQASQSEADRTIRRELRDAFETDGPLAFLQLAAANPLTTIVNPLGQSVGFVFGSGGLVGGTKAVAGKAASTIGKLTPTITAKVVQASEKAAEKVASSLAGKKLFVKADTTLQAITRFVGEGVKGVGRTALSAAPSVIPVALANAANTGTQVDEFFNKLTNEELQNIPHYYDVAANLAAAGKANDPSSVREVMKSTASRTARLTTFAGSAILPSLVPGAATVENTIFNGIARATGRDAGRLAALDAARIAGGKLGAKQILARGVGIAAAEGVTEAGDEAIQQGIQKGVTDGTVDLSNVTPGGIVDAVTSPEAQFSGLLGGLLGVVAGGGISTIDSANTNRQINTRDKQAAQDAKSAQARADQTNNTDPAAGAEVPAGVSSVQEAVAIVRALHAKHKPLFDAVDAADRARIDQIFGVDIGQGSILGVRVLHRSWPAAIVRAATKKAEAAGQAGPVAGKGITIFSSDQQAIVVDEQNNIISIKPDGTVEPITPDLNGTDEQRIAHVAVVGTASVLQAQQDLAVAANDAGDGTLADTGVDSSLLSTTRDAAAERLLQPAADAIARAAKVGEDPAVPAQAPQAVIDLLGSTQSTDANVPSRTVVQDVPAQTVAEVAPDLANVPIEEAINTATERSAAEGRSTRRAAARKALDAVRDIPSKINTIIASGFAQPGEAAEVAVSLDNAKDFPNPLEDPIKTLQRIEVAKALDRFSSLARMQEGQLDAIERGDLVDFTQQDRVVAEDQTQTLSDVINGEGLLPVSPATAPRTSRDSIIKAQRRVFDAEHAALLDKIFPATNGLEKPLDVTSTKIIDDFNAKWPYKVKAVLFENIAQYDKALKADPSLDVMPIFSDRVKEGDPRGLIVDGIVRRFSMNELLGDTGSLELLTRIKAAALNGQSVLNRISKEVRDDYKGNLSEDEIAAEAFGRALDAGFKDGQVGGAIKFLRAALIGQGAVDVVSKLSDADLRRIAVNSGGLWRAPTVSNAQGELVPDPGGAKDALNSLDGNQRGMRMVEQAMARNPASGQVGFTPAQSFYRRAIGSIFRFRPLQKFFLDTTGVDALAPMVNMFIAASDAIGQQAQNDFVNIVQPFNQEKESVQRRLGKSDADMNMQFDQFIGAKNRASRIKKFDLNMRQLRSEGITADIMFDGEVLVPSGTSAENARALIINSVQRGEVSGAAMSLLEPLVAQHAAVDMAQADQIELNKQNSLINKYRNQTGLDGTNVADAFSQLFDGHVVPIMNRIREYNKDAGIEGTGSTNYIDGLALDSYFPQTGNDTNGGGAGEIDNRLIQLGSVLYSPSNVQRHAVKDVRKSASNHMFIAITEALDLARHEVADQAFFRVIRDVAKTEYAQRLPGSDRSLRVTGADILGIEFVEPGKNVANIPRFEPGRTNTAGEYVVSKWTPPHAARSRNEFTVYTDGATEVMRINDQETAEAIAQRWPKQSGRAASELQAATRGIAATFTVLNPTFWPTQLIRDVTFTPAVIATRFGPKAGKETAVRIAKLMTPKRMAMQWQFFAATPEQQVAMIEKFKNSDDPLFKHFSELADNGGISRFTTSLDNIGASADAGALGAGSTAQSSLQRLFDNAGQAPGVAPIFRSMDAVTNAQENMHRLAAYAYLRESGVPVGDAVRGVKEIMNFSQNALQADPTLRDVSNSVQGGPGERALFSTFRNAYAFARSSVIGVDVGAQLFFKDGQLPISFVPDGNGAFTPRSPIATQGVVGGTKALFENLNYPMVGAFMAMGAMQVAMAGGIAAGVGTAAGLAGTAAVVGGATGVLAGRAGAAVGVAAGGLVNRATGTDSVIPPIALGALGAGAAATVAVAGTAALVGAAGQALDFGDDDKKQPTLADKIGPGVWGSNFILPAVDGSGTHMRIPMQIGPAALFMGIGSISALIANGNITYQEGQSEIAKLFETNATPLPRHSQAERLDASVVATLSPTILRPAIANMLNRNDFGTPIRAEGRGSGYEGSAYTRAFGSTPQEYIDVSKAMASVGLADVSPETIRFMFRSYGGAMANITDRAMRDAQRARDGLDRSTLTDGIIGAFVPNTNGDRWYPNRKFWAGHKRALRYTTLLNNRVKDDAITGKDTAGDLEKQYPGIKNLRVILGRASRQRSAINKERKLARGAPGLSADERRARGRAADKALRELMTSTADQMDAITDKF